MFSLKLGRRLRASLIAIAAASAVALSASEAAVVANDGGITLWISYDNLDTAGASVDDIITEANSMPGGFSCGPTNTGRSELGEPDSPPSCPGGTGSCSGAEKVSGDIESLADYIFQSTEGAHYLRRVYISDEGRAWDSADIKWNVGIGGSSAPFGWANSDLNMNLNSAYRTCIHDVVHHELGHYVYNLPDRYARADGYYRGTLPGDATVFDVDVTDRDINTVMSNNFPHLFVDTTNAQITVDYDPPGPGSTTDEVLAPDLLTDGDPNNDGPNRAHHGHTMPFAQDEWSLLPTRHADLSGIHTEGSFADPGARPAVDIVFIGDDAPHPGTVLLLDRSGSMGVTTNGIPAVQYVQEAGMFLYHSAEASDLVGTLLYNASVEELFPYDVYDPTNDLPFASFRNASGLTNIAAALETAIDALVAEHGEGGVNGAEIYLMSDGRQTTGASLWDQVDRANERGIKIHTFSFGNADTGTMDGIASGTSGSNTLMSERDDAAELKMLMARKFSTGRGLTPVFVFKGRMREKINLGATQIYIGQFNVPPKTRDLQFYTFLHAGDASQAFNLQLQAPGGATFNSPPPDNVATQGRFNGVKVQKPEPGTWTFLIAGQPGSSLPNEDVEIAAYADNRELKGLVWFEGVKSDGAISMRARLNFRYPLTDIKVNASLYAAGNLIAVIPMFDNGETGGDARAEDGVYSARIDFTPQEWDKLRRKVEKRTDKIRVEVEFDVFRTSKPAPFAHYETGFTRKMLASDYARGNRAAFKAWATGVLNLADLDPNRKPGKPRFGGDQPKGPVKVVPGQYGEIVFTIVNARPLLSHLRVSLGQGMHVHVKPIVGDEAASPDDNGKKKYDLKHKDFENQRQPSHQTAPHTRKFVAHFETEENAKPGPRTLRVQFGGVLLEMTNAVLVE